jgi:hypothetical protein
MHVSDASHLLRLTDGRPRLDGNAIAFRIERQDGATFDVWCFTAELTHMFSYLAHVAKAAYDMGHQETPPSRPVVAASLPLLGAGFSVDPVARNTQLVLRLPGLDLAFDMDSSRLVALAAEISRIALTLSADPRTSQ